VGLKPKKATKKRSSVGKPKYFALLRALAATIIVVLANVLKLDTLIYVLLSVVSLLIAGFDLIMGAVSSIQERKLLTYEVLTLLTAIVVFIIGSVLEACLIAIFYLVLKTALEYLLLKVDASTDDYIAEGKPDDSAILKAILSQKEATETTAEAKLLLVLDAFTKAAVFVGVLYAIFMPLITDISYYDSVRRGLMLVLLSSPLPLLVSLPVSAVVGISSSASYGVFIRDAETLEKTARLNTVVVDKSDVVTVGTPVLVSYTSPVFDNDTFLRLAAYVAYNSEQRIAAPILAAYKGEYRPEMIKDFKEIFGNSMEITINKIPICLCTKEVLDTRRIALPSFENREGLVLYMTVGGKYAGGMQFSEELRGNIKYAVEDLRAANDINVILVTEDSRRLSKLMADELDVDEFICECNSAKKLESIEFASSRLDESEVLMYVSAENLGYHTAANIDARVGCSADNADMLLADKGLELLPFACFTAKRTLKIQKENIAFAILIKLILIILAFAGIVTLWFVLMADMVAALLTVINTSRISDISVIEKLQNKL